LLAAVAVAVVALEAAAVAQVVSCLFLLLELLQAPLIRSRLVAVATEGLRVPGLLVVILYLAILRR
jgi:hypothetical protein